MSQYEGLSEALRTVVKARDNHRCRWCGRTNVGVDLHHIRYRRGVVDDVAENLICLCRTCHSFVHGVPTKAKDMIQKHEAQEILFALIDMPAATGLAYRRQLLRARQGDSNDGLRDLRATGEGLPDGVPGRSDLLSAVREGGRRQPGDADTRPEAEAEAEAR